MKLTLRKASALQNSINDAIKQIEIKSEISLTEFHSPETEISRAITEVKTNIARRDALTAALYSIRQLVSVANDQGGINGLLTSAAEVEKQIQFYSGLASKEVRVSEEVLGGKLRKLAESKDNRMYGYQDTVVTSVFSAQDIADFKKTVNHLKKRKQTIQDQILEANVRNEITLNADTVATLQAEGLI